MCKGTLTKGCVCHSHLWGAEHTPLGPEARSPRAPRSQSPLEHAGESTFSDIRGLQSCEVRTPQCGHPKESDHGHPPEPGEENRTAETEREALDHELHPPAPPTCGARVRMWLQRWLRTLTHRIVLILRNLKNVQYSTQNENIKE